MREVTLGDVAEWGSGGTPRRSVAEYFGPGVPWLSIADLNDGVVTTARESLTPSGIANSAAKIVPAGTIFVAMYGSIGKLGVAGTGMCTSQAIAFARPRTDLVEPRYLFHYLLAQRPVLQARGRGGTQMNISQGDLRNWPIPLPPLAEQRRIAAILDHADALRAKRRQSLDHLDSLPQAIFHAMFRALDSPVLTLGQVVIDTLIGLVRGAVDTGPTFRYPYMKMDAITPHGELDRTLFTATEATDSEVLRFEAREGDLMFNTRNSRELVGKSAIFRGAPALFNNNLMRIKLNDAVHVAYVHAYLHSTEGRARLESRKSGTTSVFAVYAKDLLTLPIPVPPKSDQSRFASSVEVIHRRRAIAQDALAAQDELFASLQSRAFRGEL